MDPGVRQCSMCCATWAAAENLLCCTSRGYLMYFPKDLHNFQLSQGYSRPPVRYLPVVFCRNTSEFAAISRLQQSDTPFWMAQ
eukprot:scaffold194022_cov17-Tisochrysis_lutea.AAC.1